MVNMTDHDATRPECEHRMTQLEELLKNHIPHVNVRLTRIEKILWGVAVFVTIELVGLLIFLLKGHINF